MSEPDHNPYAPPKASVNDAPAPPRVRPQSVVTAVWLLWAEFACSAVTALVSWRTEAEPVPFWFSIAWTALWFAVSVWINLRIWEGRNWARYVALAFTILGLLFLPQSLRGYYADPLSGLLLVIGIVLDIVAMVLVFGPGREFFRKAA